MVQYWYQVPSQVWAQHRRSPGLHLAPWDEVEGIEHEKHDRKQLLYYYRQYQLELEMSEDPWREAIAYDHL